MMQLDAKSAGTMGQPRLASMRSRLASREGWGTPGQYDRWRDENQSWRAMLSAAGMDRQALGRQRRAKRQARR
jgi:hypothetical protein